MTIDLDTLEAAAKAATPGPWMSDDLSNVRCTNNNHICVVLVLPTFMEKTPTLEDAAFIAAANPAVVLELIAELRVKNDLLEEIFDDCGGKNNGACPVCHTYTHKHWCWYPHLVRMLGKPLDKYDERFLAEEKK